MGTRSVVAAHALAWLMAGCSAMAGDPPPPAPAGTAGETLGVPPELAVAVRADAARRAGIEPGSVRIDVAQPVTWSDGSLGCPQPGMMYTQALVPGWRLVLVAGSQRLDYHASRRGAWLWCPPGRALPPLPRGGAV